MDSLIDYYTASIPNAERGVTLLFSAAPFPEADIHLQWRRAELGGNWYEDVQDVLMSRSPWRGEDKDTGREGWLCPALYKYFSQTPMDIYIKIGEKS